MGAYNCLKSLNDGDQATFWKNLKKTRLELVQAIGLTSLESTKSVYPALANLQFLGEIENAWMVRWGGEGNSIPGSGGTGESRAGSAMIQDLGFDIVTGGTQSLPPLGTSRHKRESILTDIHLKKIVGPDLNLPKSNKRIPTTKEMEELQHGWKERLSLMQNNFELIEPLLALGGVLLQILERPDYLPHQLRTLATLARKAGRFQIASNSLYQVRSPSLNME